MPHEDNRCGSRDRQSRAWQLRQSPDSVTHPAARSRAFIVVIPRWGVILHSVASASTSRIGFVVGLVLACGFGAGGCQSWSLFGRGGASAHESSGPVVSRSAAAALFPRESRGRAVRIIDLVFDVTQIKLPLKDVQNSRKIWNHVDELRVDTTLSAHLARNGIRVGVATMSAWGPIRAILEVVEAELRRDELVPPRGLALAISLGSLIDGDSVFTYSRSGRLIGKTFRGGEKVIDLEYVHHPQFGGAIDVSVRWEIRRDRNEVSWESRGGTIQPAPTVDRHLFNDLAVQLTLNPNEFLVIGLGADAKNPYLVGPRFLSSDRAGERTETMLMIRPRTVETTGTRRRP